MTTTTPTQARRKWVDVEVEAARQAAHPTPPEILDGRRAGVRDLRRVVVTRDGIRPALRLAGRAD